MQNNTSTGNIQNTRGAVLLRVSDNIWLFEKSFYFDGYDYLYDDINSVYYSSRVDKINLYTINSYSTLLIGHDKVNGINISYNKHDKSEVTCDKNTVSTAANIFSKLSYKQRLARYINKLNTDGYISLPCKHEIRIYPNGDVTEGDLRYNLAKCYAKKRIQIGLSFQFGLTKDIDPYEVILAEQGWLFWNKKIIFYIQKDYDVMVSILKSLSGVKTM